MDDTKKKKGTDEDEIADIFADDADDALDEEEEDETEEDDEVDEESDMY